MARAAYSVGLRSNVTTDVSCLAVPVAPPHANSTWVSDGPIDETGLLAVSCALSVLTDIVLLLVMARKAKSSMPARFVMYLAISDLPGRLPVLGVFPWPRGANSNSFVCLMQASCNWFSVISTWLWTMAYASAVQHRFSTDASGAHWLLSADHVEASTLPELKLHALCWGAPLAAVASMAATGQFGNMEGLPFCTFVNVNFAIAFNSLLWCALLWVFWTFLSVHCLLKRIAVADEGVADRETPAFDEVLLTPDAQEEVRTRLRLWPRLMLYLLAFVVSQTPCALWNLLWLTPLPEQCYSPWLGPLADCLSVLHGFLNGLVSAFTIWLDHRPSDTGERFTDFSLAVALSQARKTLGLVAPTPNVEQASAPAMDFFTPRYSAEDVFCLPTRCSCTSVRDSVTSGMSSNGTPGAPGARGYSLLLGAAYKCRASTESSRC